MLLSTDYEQDNVRGPVLNTHGTTQAGPGKDPGGDKGETLQLCPLIRECLDKTFLQGWADFSTGNGQEKPGAPSTLGTFSGPVLSHELAFHLLSSQLSRKGGVIQLVHKDPEMKELSM